MPVTESMAQSKLPFNFSLNERWNIISGKDCVKEKGAIIKDYASKVFIMTGKSSAKKSGALDDFTELFDSIGIEYKIYDRVVENPHIDACSNAAKECVEFGADGVLGIGGGSPMDAAKAVALFAVNPDISVDDLYAKKVPNKPLPVFACGTTAGTGSEVTSFSVMTLGEGKNSLKRGWGNKASCPVVTFCDPKYTLSLPKNVTVSTGIDAVAHCFEGYFKKGSGIFVRTFALAGLELIWPALKKAFSEELTLEDREKLLYGSILAGITIELSGTCFPHSAGYAITSECGTCHGFACAYFLPEFIRLHSIDYKEDTDRMLNTMGTDVDELERLFYSVLPSLPRDEKTVATLYAKAAKGKNIHASVYDGGEKFSDSVFDTVYKTLDKYGK